MPMPMPVLATALYLAVNLALTIWIVREETGGRRVPATLAGTSAVLRYGPPLLGLGYLVTIAGDWPFFLFVIAFFGIAFMLLNGLLAFPTRPTKK